VRLLIKDVMVTKREKTVRVAVRWQTQACRTLEVARPKPAYVIRRTAPEVIERIGQLARTHIDSEIATRLNDAGYRGGQGGAFTARMVKWLRYAYGTAVLRCGRFCLTMHEQFRRCNMALSDWLFPLWARFLRPPRTFSNRLQTDLLG